MGPALVVDGYNIIHAWDDLRSLIGVSLEMARDRLLERLMVFSQVTDTDVVVVFDAQRTAASRPTEEVRDGVRVVFTQRGHTADHAIERLAYQAMRSQEPMLVATSDRFHRDMLRGMGAAVIDAQELRRQVGEAEQELARRLRRYSKT
jgi:predicted RNA-binding protein with PIN domain